MFEGVESQVAERVGTLGAAPKTFDPPTPTANSLHSPVFSPAATHSPAKMVQFSEETKVRSCAMLDCSTAR